MEVTFQYSRDDWTAISVETFRLWLHRLKPMTTEERVGYVFFLILSVLAFFGMLGFVAVAPRLDFDWYWLVGAILLLSLSCLMIAAVLRPSANNTKRGLYHELVFLWKLQDRLIAKERIKQDRLFRRQEAAGLLALGIRYVCRIEEETLVWVTTFLAQPPWATIQEERIPWFAVTGVERGEQLLVIHLDQRGMLCIPRSAFAGAEEEESFVRAAEARRERVMVPVA